MNVQVRPLIADEEDGADEVAEVSDEVGPRSGVSREDQDGLA